MKRIALLLCVAFSTLFVHAAEEMSLVITVNTGEKVEFKLSTQPEITFENGMMNVIVNTGSSTSGSMSSQSRKVSFSLWKVNSLTYTGPNTGISQVSNDHEMVIEENKIIADGTHNQISAFAYDGRAIHLSPTISGDKTIISLENLQTGVYIVKINGKSIKIAKQ